MPCLKTPNFYLSFGESRRGVVSFKLSSNFQTLRTVNVVLTRYQTATVIPIFSAFLQRLPHLHTLHVLHAHTQMTTALKNGFENVTLPNIRTLIIPGYCHEILKRCPRVTTVWCIRDDGSKLVSVLATHCKEVEEMRGFSCHEKLLKSLFRFKHSRFPHILIGLVNNRNYKGSTKFTNL
jgi:hypothetical protein